jgi:hypothetical protein
MSADWQRELEEAVHSDMPLEDVVALLRRYRARGVTQGEVYALLQSLHAAAPNDARDDRILEVSDFVAGFCSRHLKVWDG